MELESTKKNNNEYSGEMENTLLCDNYCISYVHKIHKHMICAYKREREPLILWMENRRVIINVPQVTENQ